MNELSKKQYIEPEIKMTHIDNDISLALQSEPPGGPDELSDNIQPLKLNHFKV